MFDTLFSQSATLAHAVILGFAAGVYTGMRIMRTEFRILTDKHRRISDNNYQVAKWYQEQNEIFRLFNGWDGWKELDAKQGEHEE